MCIKRMTVMLVLLIGMMLGQEAQAFYNSSTGRWLSRDPILEKGGNNIYALVGNDSIRGIDALGLDSSPYPYPTSPLPPVPRPTEPANPELKSGGDYFFSREDRFKCVLKEERITKTIPYWRWDEEIHQNVISQMVVGRECIYNCTGGCLWWKHKFEKNFRMEIDYRSDGKTPITPGRNTRPIKHCPETIDSDSWPRSPTHGGTRG